MAAPSVRQLSTIFHRYEREKCAFVAAVADAARAEGAAAPLATLGAPELLLPLLCDPCPTVAQTAAFALGRIAGHSRAVASDVAGKGVMATLQQRLRAVERKAAADPDGAGAEARATRRAVTAMLVSLARHSPELAAEAAAQGGVELAVECLASCDTETRESSACALAHLVAYSPELAQAAVTAGALPLLVGCLGGEGTPLRRYCASALGDIAHHSPDLAHAVAAAGTLGAIASLLRAPLENDARLKRQLLCGLMHICHADAALAEKVVGAELVPDVTRALAFADDMVRRHAAACLREIAAHGAALAASVADTPGALDALATFAASSASVQALPALLAFGFASGHSTELAARVAATPGVLPTLTTALDCGDESAAAAAAWALGRLGGHSPALAALTAPALPSLFSLAAAAAQGSFLQSNSLSAASAILCKLEDVALLASLVPQPGLLPGLQELVLERCATVMLKAPATRATFVTAGALAFLESRAEALPPSAPGASQIAAALRLFPQELVQHFSASHAAKLLAALSVDPPPTDAIAAVHLPEGKAAAADGASAAPTTGAEPVALTHAGPAPAPDVPAEAAEPVAAKPAAAEATPAGAEVTAAQPEVVGAQEAPVTSTAQSDVQQEVAAAAAPQAACLVAEPAPAQPAAGQPAEPAEPAAAAAASEASAANKPEADGDGEKEQRPGTVPQHAPAAAAAAVGPGGVAVAKAAASPQEGTAEIAEPAAAELAGPAPADVQTLAALPKEDVPVASQPAFTEPAAVQPAAAERAAVEPAAVECAGVEQQDSQVGCEVTAKAEVAEAPAAAEAAVSAAGEVAGAEPAVVGEAPVAAPE